MTCIAAWSVSPVDATGAAGIVEEPAAGSPNEDPALRGGGKLCVTVGEDVQGVSRTEFVGRVGRSVGSRSEGTWLQLMRCALLYTQFQYFRLVKGFKVAGPRLGLVSQVRL